MKQRCQIELREQHRLGTDSLPACHVSASPATGGVTHSWEQSVLIMIVPQRQANLLEMISALDPSGRFTSLLDCRKQKSDENGENRHHDQDFD